MASAAWAFVLALLVMTDPCMGFHREASVAVEPLRDTPSLAVKLGQARGDDPTLRLPDNRPTEQLQLALSVSTCTIR